MLSICNMLPTTLAAIFWFAEPPIYFKFINLAIFLGAVVFLVRKPFMQAMDDRRKAIQSELKRAKAEKEAAETKLREIQDRLNRLNDEVAQIRTQAEQEAKAEYARLAKQTEEDADRLRVIAEREIEGAVKAAQLELKEFVATKSVELAEAMIRKELKPEDNARLVADYAKELEGVK